MEGKRKKNAHLKSIIVESIAIYTAQKLALKILTSMKPLFAYRNRQQQ